VTEGDGATRDRQGGRASANGGEKRTAVRRCAPGARLAAGAGAPACDRPRTGPARAGFEPARLPAVLLNIAAYKLTFLAALSSLAVGASLMQYGRRAGAGTRLRAVADPRGGGSPPAGP
jgi:hypothetical protein